MTERTLLLGITLTTVGPRGVVAVANKSTGEFRVDGSGTGYGWGSSFADGVGLGHGSGSGEGGGIGYGYGHGTEFWRDLDRRTSERLSE